MGQEHQQDSAVPGPQYSRKKGTRQRRILTRARGRHRERKVERTGALDNKASFDAAWLILAVGDAGGHQSARVSLRVRSPLPERQGLCSLPFCRHKCESHYRSRS
jgi:hypothetical protein